MKIQVNGITLNYNKTGKGNPLILLHGNGEDLHIFDELAHKLGKDYSIYAIDSRNHGESSKTNDYSYESMAQDVFCFVQVLELRNVSLIGFSDGAIIGILLATKYENLFQKMVLLGPNLKPSDFKKKEYNFLVSTYKKTQDPFFKLMLEQPDIKLETLKKIKTRTLVVGAQYDVFYRKVFINIADAIPEARLKIMKGHDHASYIVNTDILYHDLKEFIE